MALFAAPFPAAVRAKARDFVELARRGPAGPNGAGAIDRKKLREKAKDLSLALEMTLLDAAEAEGAPAPKSQRTKGSGNAPPQRRGPADGGLPGGKPQGKGKGDRAPKSGANKGGDSSHRDGHGVSGDHPAIRAAPGQPQPASQIPTEALDEFGEAYFDESFEVLETTLQVLGVLQHNLARDDPFPARGADSSVQDPCLSSSFSGYDDDDFEQSLADAILATDTLLLGEARSPENARNLGSAGGTLGDDGGDGEACYDEGGYGEACYDEEDFLHATAQSDDNGNILNILNNNNNNNSQNGDDDGASEGETTPGREEQNRAQNRSNEQNDPLALDISEIGNTQFDGAEWEDDGLGGRRRVAFKPGAVAVRRTPTDLAKDIAPLQPSSGYSFKPARR